MLELDEITEGVLCRLRDACNIHNWQSAHRLLEQIDDLVLRGICYSYIFEKMNVGLSIVVFLDNVLVGETSKI